MMSFRQRGTEVTATMMVGQGFEIEVQAMVIMDNARDPIRGQSEPLIEGDVVVLCPRTGTTKRLASRYQDAASDALYDALSRP